MFRVLRLVICLVIFPPLASVAASSPAPEAAQPSAPGIGTRQARQLDIDIVVFDPGIPADASEHRRLGIFPRVRKAESRYLPFLLRRTLADSGEWGVVRVRGKSDIDQASELSISGAIQKSDGEQLILNIQAVDGAGRVWLDKTYEDIVTEADYQNDKVDPFQDLFDRIAGDLLAMRATLTPGQLLNVVQITTLRYGMALSPRTFNDYLRKDESGLYRLLRLPAKNDPMLNRIGRIREYEYLFIDTENEQYLDLFQEMRRSYLLWRQYSRELVVYIRNKEERAANEPHPFRRGSFASMNDVYGDYAWFRKQERYMAELSKGFNNEIVPTVMELDNSVVKLKGNLESKYAQWRSILRSMFELERGEEGAPAP